MPRSEDIQPSPPPPATRRPHKKSRQGCADCRARRVKCSEDKPRCRQCARRDIPCIYRTTKPDTAPSPPLNNNSDTAPYGATSVSWPSPDTSSSQEHFTARDLALLHRWTTVTSRSIVNDETHLLHFWQIVFPEVGVLNSRPDRLLRCSVF